MSAVGGPTDGGNVAHVHADYRLHVCTDYRLHVCIDYRLHVCTDYRLHEVVDKRGTCLYRLQATCLYRLHEVVDNCNVHLACAPLINALRAQIIHINLNTIFYTHVEDSPTKTIYIRHNIHTQTHTLTVAQTGCL